MSESLKERMQSGIYEQPKNIGQLAKALSEAQNKIERASKDSANPFFKSRYADLTSVWNACQKPLSEHGLSIVQIPGRIVARDGGHFIELTTILLHSSGESISGQMEIPIKELTAQSIGSAITYGRRYALSAMVGVAPEDDDGHAATQPQAPKQWSRPTAQNTTPRNP